MYVVYELKYTEDSEWEAIGWFEDKERALEYETHLAVASITKDPLTEVSTVTRLLPDDYVVGTGRVTNPYVGEDFDAWLVEDAE